MDVNGTRFHLLSGRSDWASHLGASEVAWDEQRGSVTLAPRLIRLPERGGQTLDLEQRRGAAGDRYGNFYWIDTDRQSLRFRPPGAADSKVWWSVEDLNRKLEPVVAGGGFQPVAADETGELPTLRGLAVTDQHYLVVGTVAPAGLLVFDLHAGTPPVWRRWPVEVPLNPFAIEPAAGGGLWVLDRPADSEPPRLWRLDGYFRLLDTGSEVELGGEREEDFRPVAGSSRIRPGRSFPAAVTLDLSSPLTGLEAVALAVLPDATLLVLESDPTLSYSRLHRFDGPNPLGEPISLAGILDQLLDSDDTDLSGHDMAFQPAADGSSRGDLYIVGKGGDQTMVFSLRIGAETLELNPTPRYLPMRQFSGKAVVATTSGEVYYDFADRWLPLVDQPRMRYASSGTLSGLVFDGKEPDCVWHRLIFDGQVPPGDRVEVETRAAERPELLRQLPWQSEPAPIQRASGSELPFHRPFSANECGGQGVGTWELLFQQATGRYLEVRLKLIGGGRSTPRLRSLRVYYPRFSYLAEYLPAVYRQDETSAAFLDRYLANPEGLLSDLEGRIAEAQALFDLRSSDPEALEWLAGWMGAMLDPDWDEDRRRLFLAHAEQLYRWRGTRAGLLRTLRLAIDTCPEESLFAGLEAGSDRPAELDEAGSVRIVEGFLGRQLPGVMLGDLTELEGPVLVTPGPSWDPSQGAAALHQRYRDYLRRLYSGGEGSDSAALERLNAAWGRQSSGWSVVRFSPVPPAAGGTELEDWRRFTREGVGFSYAEVTAADEPIYRDFLARRYGSPRALSRSHGLEGSRALRSFAELSLPSEDFFPENAAALSDWIRFVSLALPIQRNAHRFTVLVPAEPGESLEVRQRRLERVREITEREKPAHTEFEVKLFWDLFRVGGARLGIDTQLGQGSRYTALALGSTYLGETFLAESHPWNVADRRVLGRDPLTEI